MINALAAIRAFEIDNNYTGNLSIEDLSVWGDQLYKRYKMQADFIMFFGKKISFMIFHCS